MLVSPTHVVIGAADLEAAVSWWSRLGLDEVSRREVASPHLYGVGRVTEVELAAPGAGDGGRLLLVSGARDLGPRGVWDRGAQAVDLYTRDTTASLDLLSPAAAGPTGHVVLGPVEMRQTMVTSPEGASLVLIEADRRRASLLDTTDRLHSQVHSLVWCVDDIDGVSSWWAATTGLQVPMVFGFESAEVGRFMGLPRLEAPIRMCMLSDEANSPVRLELLEFTDEPGPVREDLPLVAGLHAVRFAVTDVTSAAATLAAAGAVVGAVVDGSCTFTSPGGVRGQLVGKDL